MASVARANHNPTMMKVMNPIMKFVVQRGWGSMADDIMVLHWTGKKSGRAYSTPVSRFELDGQLFTQTKSGYKANFVGGGPAELLIGGSRKSYIGTVDADPAAVGQRMASVLSAMGTKKGARALGLKIDGEPDVAELTEFAAADGAVIIDFQPA